MAEQRLLSENELDAMVVTLDNGSEAPVRSKLVHETATGATSNLLGQRDTHVPIDVHERMLDLACSSQIPISSLQQRRRNKIRYMKFLHLWRRLCNTGIFTQTLALP